MTTLLNPEADPFDAENDNRMESINVIPPRCPQPGIRRWTVAEYYRAAEVGIFHPDERLELIDGEVWCKVAPQNRTHPMSVTLSATVLDRAFGTDFHLQREQPIQAPRDSEPEPDLAVLPGKPEDYLEHPNGSDTVLIMEVSDSSLRIDRGRKSSMYAASGAPEYWVLDLQNRRLEVRREPAPAPRSRFGYDYRQITRYSEDDIVCAMFAPHSPIVVKDLLPPAGLPVLSETDPEAQEVTESQTEETTSS